MKLIDKNTLQASETVTIGAGGTGANVPQGRAGGAGMVIVYEYQ